MEKRRSTEDKERRKGHMREMVDNAFGNMKKNSEKVTNRVPEASWRVPETVAW